MPDSGATKTKMSSRTSQSSAGRKLNQRQCSVGKGWGMRTQGGAVVWCLRPQNFGLTDLSLTLIPPNPTVYQL